MARQSILWLRAYKKVHEYGFNHFVWNATVMSFVYDFRQNQWTQKSVLTTFDSTVLCYTTDGVTKQNLYTNIYITVVVVVIDLITLLSIYVLENLHLSQIIIIIIIIILFYSCLLVIRWQGSGKSRSQQEIKAVYPSTLQILWAVLISVI
jgi:uncharacterized membrane protein